MALAHGNCVSDRKGEIERRCWRMTSNRENAADRGARETRERRNAQRRVRRLVAAGRPVPRALRAQARGNR